MRSDLVEITIQRLHETEKAVLVTDSIHEKGVWLAKSMIEIEPSVVGGLFTVTMPEWLALEKGLI